jgi:hypothetical protein
VSCARQTLQYASLLVGTETLRGKRVVRVERLFYVLPDGAIQGDRGSVVLTDSDQTVLRLGVGADCVALNIDEGPWRDPFGAPQSAANADFVSRSGKWVAFDLSDVPPYSRLLGLIVSMEAIQLGEKVVGIALTTDAGADVQVTCDGDEIRALPAGFWSASSPMICACFEVWR